MKLTLKDPRWSDQQREFLAALDSAGASRPDQARSLNKLPPLASRELNALVDAGIVREAASSQYYLYHRQELIENAAPKALTGEWKGPQFRGAPGSRMTKTILFWFVVMIIPIIMIQCIGATR
jgi:hypothetical protein